MKDSFEAINNVFNIEPTKKDVEIVETSTVSTEPVSDDVSKDYSYTRSSLYSLLEKGQEAIDGALEVAQSSDHPRAYEVAGNLIKNVSEVAEKLIDLQKKMKELDNKYNGPKNVTNALFVGSTAELSKLLKQGLIKQDEER
jgi:hypothetical protein